MHKNVTRLPIATSRLSSRTPELSRLSEKAWPRSLQFRRSTPGSAAYLVNGVGSQEFRNPSHPALQENPKGLRMKNLPTYDCPAFTLRCIPMDLLVEAPPFPYPTLHDFGRTKKRGRKLVRFSLQVIGTPGNVVQRYRIKNRVKEAISLVAIRGAYLQDDGVLAFDAEVDSQQWLLQDWTYLLQPRLGVFRMHMKLLVHEARTALAHLKSAAPLWVRSGWERRKPYR